MLKKLGFISFILIVIIAAVFLFLTKDNKDTNDQENHNQLEVPPTNEEHTSESEQETKISEEDLIRNIYKLSKNGQIPNSAIIVGKTNVNEIHDKWGKPEQTTNVTNGIYEMYSKQNTSIGYQDNIIFDVRSYDSDLSNIHLKGIKNELGEPDEVRYYKDQTYNQIILVYQVNQTFQLKWILPKPSDDKPNPSVHHISVLTEATKQGNTEPPKSDGMGEMSLDEKIGQMVFAGMDGTTFNTETRALIKDNKVGGIIFYSENLTSPSQTVKLLNEIKAENAGNPFPLLLGTDQEGGRVSRLPGGLVNHPTNMKIGEVGNPNFSYEIGELLGKEMNAFGFNLDFAPVLDVNSNPNNPVIGDRSFGDNPELVSKLGIETMKGIQSQQIIPVIKHFPGHGDTSVDSHLQLPIVKKSMGELQKLELIPFRNAIKERADVVMIAHILLPKIDPTYPATMSKQIITDVLREQLNFDGVVMTDDMTMEAITDNYNIGNAAVQSVKAGSDIILVAHKYDNALSVISALKTAVKNGEITVDRINQSVERIIQLKKKYDLNNEKVNAVDIGALNQSINHVLNKYME